MISLCQLSFQRIYKLCIIRENVAINEQKINFFLLLKFELPNILKFQKCLFNTTLTYIPSEHAQFIMTKI